MQMKTNLYTTRYKVILLFSLLFLIQLPYLSAQQSNDELLELLIQKKIIGKAEADSIRATHLLKQTELDKSKPKGRIWGLVYTDVLYKAHADSAKRGNVQYSGSPKDSSAIDFRRIFLGYDYNFNERFSSEFILAHESTADALQSGNSSVYIKAANLRWHNFIPLADLVVGVMGTPTFFFASEKVWGNQSAWGYRSIERTIADMRKLGIASDAGIALQGTFTKTGTFGYNLMVGNGSGTKPETDKFKRLYADVYGKFLDQKIIVDCYGDYERSRLTPYQQGKSTFKLFIAYQAERVAGGIEVVQQFQQNATIYTEPKAENPSVASTKKDTVAAIAFGVSVFVRGSLIKERLAAFARYDFFNPDLAFLSNRFYNSAYTGNTTQTFITAGLDYSPDKNVHIMPNVWYNSYDANNDAANKIHANSLLRYDYDLVYRVTLYYVFK
jgi:hypothetical protein